MSLKYIFILACLIFINCVNAVLQKAQAPKGLVILIRHAEKPVSGNDLSHDGWRRAECIRDLFTTNTNLTPKKIYAQKASKKKETVPDSRRQIETVAPLARKLDITIDNSYTSYDVDELSKKIISLQESDFPVMVSWNHDDIRVFLINFGMKYQIAPTYPKHRYDLVWTAKPENGELVFDSFSQNCEGLGDYRFSNTNAANNRLSSPWMKFISVITLFALYFIYF